MLMLGMVATRTLRGDVTQQFVLHQNRLLISLILALENRFLRSLSLVLVHYASPPFRLNLKEPLLVQLVHQGDKMVMGPLGRTVKSVTEGLMDVTDCVAPRAEFPNGCPYSI